MEDEYRGHQAMLKLTLLTALTVSLAVIPATCSDFKTDIITKSSRITEKPVKKECRTNADACLNACDSGANDSVNMKCMGDCLVDFDNCSNAPEN